MTKLALVVVFLIGLVALSFICVGCLFHHNPTIAGIPNLHEFLPGKWRGGQPVTKAAFKYLRDKCGITNIVVLNMKRTEANALDEMIAVPLGIRVHRFEIPTDMQMFGPDRELAKLLYEAAVAAGRQGTFIHCGSVDRTKSWLAHATDTQGGQERTGALAYLIERDSGISKEASIQHLNSFGYHWALVPALDKFILAYRPL